jgi:phosphatidylserine/phosphatidylglycerophosphate/cardiolipin synthase-like enzyme
VLLGIDMPAAASKGVLGFAIERHDRTENEKYWLRGQKTFLDTDPGAPPGTPVSLREHPVQGFQWSDFTAKPGHDYTYRVVALTGKPKNLVEAMSVSVDIATEKEEQGQHSVWFNRGVAGSQAYARRFDNRKPDDVPDRQAYAWLSRGLVEALTAFIKQAKKGYSLRAAVYELDYAPVLEAFASAKKAGADVKIIFDAKRNGKDDPDARNRTAIETARIEALTIPREANPSYLAHNKFIVLMKGDKAVAVWTGSTNLTNGGIFGHSNVGHVVRDAGIAAAYLDYWQQLSEDPEAKQLRPWNSKRTATPQGAPPVGISAIFSPRASIDALEWYAERMRAASAGVFLTAAFGVNDLFMKVLGENVDFLRYVMLEKIDGDVDIMRRDPDNRVSTGAVLEEAAAGQWKLERLIPGMNAHVRFLHTKYLLIDPLSDDPIVITGSANFSDASTRSSDENMIVIRGDKRVADIYLGEFMRLFTHFYFRDFATGPVRHLVANDAWRAPFYVADSSKAKERHLFAGTGEAGAATRARTTHTPAAVDGRAVAAKKNGHTNGSSRHERPAPRSVRPRA